jgi:purine catabolism regulator
MPDILTVNNLWHLALPPGTALVGGEGGLSRPVEWVTSLRAAFPIFGALSKNYVAVARLEVARRLDPRLTAAYLIRELDRVQAAALVIAEHIAPTDAALADALRLPVLVLPEGMDIYQVERDALRALVDREGQMARRQTESRDRFQQLLGQGGVQAVADELARLVAGQVVLLDGGDTVVAHASAAPSLTEREEAAYPVSVAGRSLGKLVLRTAVGRANPLDALLARQAAEVCAIEMLQQQTRQETEERLGASLLEQLLDPNQPEEAVAARFVRLGYPLAADRRHLVVALGGAVGSSCHTACHDAARDLLWAVRRDGAGALTIAYRRYHLVFCSLPPAVSERQARGWVRQLAEGEAGGQCSAGVSRLVDGIPGLREAVSQAISAWDLGQCIANRAAPYYYEELGLYRLLASLRERDELRRFYEETLGDLVRYDQEHDAELVHTLDVFFAENANVSQASRALYVHRNTLNYRLQRVVDISGLDLNDPETRLALQLALKVYHLSQGQLDG